MKELNSEMVKQTLGAEKHSTVVFLYREEDFEGFTGGGGKGIAGFFRSEDNEKAAYLSQWDYGEYHDSVDMGTKVWGINHTIVDVTVENSGHYKLIYNAMLGYAVLYVLEEKHEDL